MTKPTLILLAAALVAAAGGSAQQQQQKDPPKKKEYVGSETCAGCHEEAQASFKKNAHISLETNKKRGWQEKACESCHGPGSVHAETNEAKDILSPKQMAPAAVDALCLGCHKNQMTQVGRLQSGHARNAVACTSCHNVHKTGAESSAVQLSKASGINKNCASCHVNSMMAFNKPHHHKVPEGVMACTSCHNPHASFLNKNLRLANANEPGCLNCHAGYRGPYIFEHAPVKNEPCTTCHEPHGSVNPRMLTRHEVAPLCLECHSNIQSGKASGTLGGIPPSFHDLSNPRYRNCTICHQKVHGSNASRGLFR